MAEAKARKQVAEFWVMVSRMQAPGGMLGLVLEKMNVHTAMIDSGNYHFLQAVFLGFLIWNPPFSAMKQARQDSGGFSDVRAVLSWPNYLVSGLLLCHR